MSGCAQVLSGHPFDLIKVRLQTQPDPPRYRGILHCVRLTVQEEGLRGLYRGISPPLLGAGLCNAVLFASYGLSTRLLAPPGLPGGGDRPLSLVRVASAGSLAGITMAFVNCPIELLKIRLQTQAISGHRYAGLWDCAVQTWRSGGLGGLYRGLPITLLREVPSFAAYFGVYEGVKRAFRSSDPAGSSGPAQPAQLLFAGGCAGIAAWLVCYPQDVLKSRIQMDAAPQYARKPMSAYAQDIVRSEAGWRGFAKGLSPTLLRAFPANAATFLAYELTLAALGGS